MLESLTSVSVGEEVEALWEVEDVMRCLKCSRAAVSRYMRDEQLPYIKLGKKKTAHLRFRPAKIQEWLEKQEIIEPCKA